MQRTYVPPVAASTPPSLKRAGVPSVAAVDLDGLRWVDAVMPQGRSVEATAAVLVTLPGGEGRLMGEAYDARVTTVTPEDLGDHIRGLAHAGATHLQLVLDPVTADAVDTVGAALADLDR